MHCIPIVFIIFVSSMFASAADTAAQVALLTRVASDIRSNQNEYLQFFETGTVPLPLNVMQIVGQITDESYTTLVQNQELMTQLGALVTQLPWYNERLAGGKVASVTAAGSGEDDLEFVAASFEEKSNNGGVGSSGNWMFGSLAGVLLALI